MRNSSQPSVSRLHNALPYPFSKRAHRTVWAIGALVLFLTVPFLNSKFQTHASPPDKTIQPVGSATPHAKIKLQDNSSTVRINDQVIPLPADGSIHKTIHSDGGQTKVDVSVDASSSGDQANSSTNFQLNINSQQETTINNSE